MVALQGRHCKPGLADHGGYVKEVACQP